jgi:hypothetical protein
VSVHPGILEKKLFKICKKWKKIGILASKIHQKTFSELFFDKNWCKATQRTEKNSKIGILIIFAKNMTVQSWHNFENKKITQLSITSWNMIIFELFKNKNWSSNICPQTDFKQFLSLAFQNCAASIEKCQYFQKKGKKIKNSKFCPDRKKNYFG